MTLRVGEAAAGAAVESSTNIAVDDRLGRAAHAAKVATASGAILVVAAVTLDGRAAATVSDTRHKAIQREEGHTVDQPEQRPRWTLLELRIEQVC